MWQILSILKGAKGTPRPSRESPRECERGRSRRTREASTEKLPNLKIGRLRDCGGLRGDGGEFERRGERRRRRLRARTQALLLGNLRKRSIGFEMSRGNGETLMSSLAQGVHGAYSNGGVPSLH